MRAWRPMLRRARRLALRSPWRTLSTGFLVLAAVAAGTVFMAAVWGHHERTTDPAAEFGRADALYRIANTEDLAVVVEAQPPGSETVTVQTLTGLQTTGDLGAGLVTAYQGPWDDGLLDGVLHLVDGTLPGAGEVVVGPQLARQLDLRVGDTLRMVRPRADLEVVGIGQVGDLADDSIALAPGELLPIDDAVTPATSYSLYVATPPGATAPQVGPTLEEGGTIDGPLASGSVAAPYGFVPTEPSLPTGALVGILVGVVLVVGLTAGAAFGIGAARRRRASGLLAANGADAAQLRVATASEAMVVAAPAALVGLAAGVAVAPVWTSRQLPGWTALVDASVPWPWVVGGAAVAVVAAAVGAVRFSRQLRTSPTPALLDGRAPARGARRRHSGLALWLSVAAIVWVWSLTVGARFAFVGTLALGLAAGLWLLIGLGVLQLARRLLGREPVGRLVLGDLRGRPMGSVAAVTVVSVWVFVALTGTATDWFRFPEIGGAPVTEDASTPAGGVFVRATGPSSLAQRNGPPPVEPLPPGLAAELADAGLVTTPALVGSWTGECSACPQGWTPSVAVLDTVEGTGLPPETAALLESGAAVTQYAIDGIEGQTVAGVPVRIGDLSLGVDAAVLRSPTLEGERLVDVVPALIGSTGGLSDDQLDDVVEILGDAGVYVSTWDDRVDRRFSWNDSLVARDPAPVALWGWLVLLLLVTLAVTAAHRREHGEAARVLQVLGAAPSAARRLSSTTAGTLAGAGVGIGLAASLVLLAVASSQRREGLAVEPYWSREATLVLVASLAVPMVVAVLARLIPPARPSPEAAAPA